MDTDTNTTSINMIISPSYRDDKHKCDTASFKANFPTDSLSTDKKAPLKMRSGVWSFPSVHDEPKPKDINLVLQKSNSRGLQKDGLAIQGICKNRSKRNSSESDSTDDIVKPVSAQSSSPQVSIHPICCL